MQGCLGTGSKNRINERTIELLEKLAVQAQVPQFIEKMFRRACHQTGPCHCADTLADIQYMPRFRRMVTVGLLGSGEKINFTEDRAVLHVITFYNRPIRPKSWGDISVCQGLGTF